MPDDSACVLITLGRRAGLTAGRSLRAAGVRCGRLLIQLHGQPEGTHSTNAAASAVICALCAPDRGLLPGPARPLSLPLGPRW